MEFMDVETLRHKIKVLYVLDDVMISPMGDDDLRLVRHKTTELYEEYFIDNGGGNKMMIRFFEQGVLVKGFDHENELNQFGADEWDNGFFIRMFAVVPDSIMATLTENDRDCSTFCMWYSNDTGEWYQNEVEGNDGGKDYLLGYLPQSVQDLVDWRYYYGKTLNESVLEKLYKTAELSEKDKAELVVGTKE